MSYVTLHFVYCDGGDECPMESEALECDPVEQSITETRKWATLQGWAVARRGKDYCPQCVERLGIEL